MRAESGGVWDVVVIGGGPAGLSAALVLGRCRRRVVVVDAGAPRNAKARTLNGFLTRDGIKPLEVRRLARAEVARYGVRVRRDLAVDARCEAELFRVRLRSGATLVARKLLIATGVLDRLPDIPGFADLYGSSIHHCPYCDAYGHRDKRIAAYGKGRAAIGLALTLRTWSRDVVACTDGHRVSAERMERARANNISVRTERVARLEGSRGRLRAIHFEGGPALRCDAMFFNTGQVQRSDLPALLGCAYKPDGGVRTVGRQRTVAPGVFLAGDAHKEVQFVIVAAAEGAIAAVAMNRELQEEDAALRERGARGDE